MASSPYLRLLESVASGQLDENEALSALINAGLAQALPHTEPRAIAKKMLQQRALRAAKKMVLPAASIGALGFAGHELMDYFGGEVPNGPISQEMQTQLRAQALDARNAVIKANKLYMQVAGKR